MCCNIFLNNGQPIFGSFNEVTMKIINNCVVLIYIFLASRSPSPTGSRTSELGDSRSHTPSEDDIRNKTLTKEDEDELAERSGKDSPTPDRESLKIDEMESLSHQHNGISSGVNECKRRLALPTLGLVDIHVEKEMTYILSAYPSIQCQAENFPV